MVDPRQTEAWPSAHTARIARASEAGMHQRILVPVDGSPTLGVGLAKAIQLARLAGAQWRLLHAVDEMPFVMSAEGFRTMAADVLTLMREAGERILHGRSGVERIPPESDAERALPIAPVPVLPVRASKVPG